MRQMRKHPLAGILGGLILTSQVWGRTVAIKVVDAIDGKPIVGAVVSKLITVNPPAKPNPFARWTEPTELVQIGKTDSGGKIRLDCKPAERAAFVITVPGMTPRPFGFWGCIPSNYRVALSKSIASLRGRILDSAGEPVANSPVRVEIRDWTLDEPVRFSDRFPYGSYEIDGQTDSAGWFAMPVQTEGYIDDLRVHQNGGWRSVTPPNPDWDVFDRQLRGGTFVGRVDANGPALDFVPATQPVAIPALTIHLRVLDAVTGKPIAHVRVMPGGAVSPEPYFRSLPSDALELSGNDITWSFYDSAWAYYLRVEADGYATTPTRIVKASERHADIELKMARATHVALRVLTPAGQPAAGALVY
ncbi:MAG TPA: hypothetical protein VG722_12800, partial [Tepidisphaeraceae bacterium]|nr:hypothetical protein [Tepidisphaeraceae bacterium]